MQNFLRQNLSFYHHLRRANLTMLVPILPAVIAILPVVLLPVQAVPIPSQPMVAPILSTHCPE
jgi:hypothetical protein